MNSRGDRANGDRLMRGRGRGMSRGGRSAGPSRNEFSRGRGRGGPISRGRGDSRRFVKEERGGLHKRKPQGFPRGDRGSSTDYNQPNESSDNGFAQKKAYPKKKFNPEGNNKQNLTTLAESILSKGVSQEEKEKQIERTLLILDEYGIDNVVVKSSGCRLVQACLKYGNNSSKELIFLKLMKCDLEKILKDQFGRVFFTFRQIYCQESDGPFKEQEPFSLV